MSAGESLSKMAREGLPEKVVLKKDLGEVRTPGLGSRTGVLRAKGTARVKALRWEFVQDIQGTIGVSLAR